MVESSLERRAYQMVMGLALEARRTDLIERIILLCDAKPGELEHDASTIKMLEYCFGLFSSAVVPRSFRATLIALLVQGRYETKIDGLAHPGVVRPHINPRR